MNEFDNLVDELDAEVGIVNANAKVNKDNFVMNIDQPATASVVNEATEIKPESVTKLNEAEKNWNELSTSEKIGAGISAGWNTVKLSSDVADYSNVLEQSQKGIEAYEFDDPNVVEQIEGTHVGSTLKQHQGDVVEQNRRNIVDTLAEGESIARPPELQQASEAVQGKGFFEGMGAAAHVLWEGDTLGALGYLTTSSLTAFAPTLLTSAVGGGVVGAGMKSATLANAVRAAITGVGSFNIEKGSYLAGMMQEQGVDVNDPEAVKSFFMDEDNIRKANLRAGGVSVLDALSAGIATWSPLSKVSTQTRFGRVGKGLATIGTQSTIQGALGGAGEALGSIAAGDEVNSADVLFEMIGEFTTAPVEVGTYIASEVKTTVNDQIQSNQAIKAEKVLNKQIETAVEAVSDNVQNESVVDTWAKSLGKSTTLFAFAQDLIDNGQVEKLQELNPELAQKIVEAANEQQSVEISVSDVVKLATQDMALAQEVIHDSRTTVDGMTPRQAEDYQKNGKVVDKSFKKIANKATPIIEIRKQAKAIADAYATQLVKAGESKSVAQMQVQPWEAMLTNTARLLKKTPAEVAKMVNLRINGAEEIDYDAIAPKTKKQPKVPVEAQKAEEAVEGQQTSITAKPRLTLPEKPKRTIEREKKVKEKGASPKRATFAPTSVTNEKPVIIQNRDRSRPGLVSQMQKIAANPDYKAVSFSRDFGNGAPVVAYGAVAENQLGREDFAKMSNGKLIKVRYAVVDADSVQVSNSVDGTVNPKYNTADASYMRAIAGNGRIAGLQEAFNRKTAEQYVNEMKEDADTTGIDPEVVDSMAKPILVRIMQPEDVTADIGDISNTTTTAQLSDFQQANNDAERLDFEKVSFQEDGSIDENSVIDFIRQMPVSEQDKLITGNGRPTKSAYERLENALIAKAYQDDELTQLATESTKEEAKNVIGALVSVAPKYVRLLDSDYDFRDILTGLAHLAVEASRESKSLENYVNQSSDLSFDGVEGKLAKTADPLTVMLAQEVAGITRSRKSIIDLLDTLAEKANDEQMVKDSEQGDMFGGVSYKTREEVFKEAIADAKLKRIDDGASGLFQEDKIISGDEKLSAEVEVWGETVESLEKKPSQPIVMLTQTPLVMNLVGAKFLELRAHPHLFDGVFPGSKKSNPNHHEHPEMTRDVLKQIPMALTDPIAIFEDELNQSKVFMLELKDDAGNTVIAPLAFSANGYKGEINLVKTAHGRSRLWFVLQAQNENVLYVNREKMKRWSPTSGANSLLDYTASNDSVLTEENLVKLKQEKPAFYQTAYHGTPHVFDKFNLKAIGTGEGAQAHGWGLYFAKNKAIAARYREYLTSKNTTPKLLYKGEPIENLPENVQSLLQMLTKNLGLSRDIKAEYDNLVYHFDDRFKTGDYVARILEKYIDLIDKTPKLSITAFVKAVDKDDKYRIKYAVDAARNLAAQENRRATIQDVRKVLYEKFETSDNYRKEHKASLDALRAVDPEDLSIDTTSDKGRLFEVDIPEDTVLLDEQKYMGSSRDTELRSKIEWIIQEWDNKHPGNPLSLPESPNGREIYQAISDALGGPKEASLYLNRYGIKGITYDGSRDGRCYVVFDDEAINVLDFYQKSKDQGQVRGSYSPHNTADKTSMAGVISLMQNSNKSTFLHESAHAWLDMYTMLSGQLMNKIVAGEKLTSGEREFVNTLGGFFRWGQDEGVLDLGVTEDIDTVFKAVQAWQSMTVEEQRGMHELFARGFESYIIEGNAPSNEMKTLFERFKAWLIACYEGVADQLKPISPEVKKLYDLLFISQQEASDAEMRAGLVSMFDYDDKKLNMTDSERDQLKDIEEEAKLETEGIVRKQISGVIRMYTNIRQKAADQIRAEHGERVDALADELSKEPRFVARSILIDGIKNQNIEGGVLSVKLDPMALRASGYKEPTIKALEKMGYVNVEGKSFVGESVSDKKLAVLVNYDNPRLLISELLETVDAREEATKIVAAQIKHETGESPERYTQLQSDVAAHNKTRARLLTAEHNILARLLGKPSVLAKAAKDFAETKINSMKVSDVMPYVFVQNEKRCAKQAEESYRKGDFEASLDAKRGQIVNFAMAKAALELRTEFEKTTRCVRRAVKSKTLYKPYQTLLVRIAEIHGVIPLSDKRKKVTIEDVESVVKDLEESGTPIDGLANAFSDHDSYKDMTVQDARNLFTLLRELETVARYKEASNLLATKKRIGEIVEEGKKKIDDAIAIQGKAKHLFLESPKTLGDKVRNTLDKMFTSHIKIQSYCRIFDRNKDNGYFWNLFIRSANERADFETQWRSKVTEQLKDILTPVFGKKGMFSQDFVRIGEKNMSKGERFAAALNLGNDSNRKRLIKGDPTQWTEDNIIQLQKSLTTEDWKAVQKVWDLFESLRPMIAEKQKRVYGEEPDWIEATPLSIDTKNGSVKLQGGYYPVVYDPFSSNRADRQNDASHTAQALRGAFQSATTARSFTKTRVKDPDVGPLRLDMTGLYNGLNDVIHDLAWHEWLIETRRVLNGVNGDNTGLRQKIKESYGYNVAKAFETWREDIAQGDRIPTDAVGVKTLRLLSGNVGAAMMGWSVTSAVIQLTGLGYIIPRCGVSNTLSAIRQYATNPREARKTINDVSPMMRERARTINRQISEVKNRLEEGRINPIREHAYVLLVAVQGVVDTISWLASYNKSMQNPDVLKSENPQELAWKIADQDVADTQSSGRTSDMSHIENSDLLQPLTVFYSFMNTALNHTYTIYKGEENKRSKYLKILWMSLVLPIIEETLRSALQVSDEDDDKTEEEKIQAMLLKDAGAIVSYHLGLFVGLREISSAVSNKIQGEPVYGYSGPAGFRAAASLNELVQKSDDPFSWSFLKSFIDVVSLAFGFPSVQINKSVKGIRAIESGQAEDFEAIKAPVFGFKGQIKE